MKFGDGANQSAPRRSAPWRGFCHTSGLFLVTQIKLRISGKSINFGGNSAKGVTRQISYTRVLGDFDASAWWYAKVIGGQFAPLTNFMTAGQITFAVDQ